MLFYTVDGFHGLGLRAVEFCQIKNFGIDQLNFLAVAELRLLLCSLIPSWRNPWECASDITKQGWKQPLEKGSAFTELLADFVMEGTGKACLRSELC